MFSNRKLISLLAIGLMAAVFTGCSNSTNAPTTLDLAPPAIPTHLSANYTGENVLVEWAPNNTDTDFVGFRVIRVAGGQTTIMVGPPTNITHYADLNPQQGQNTYQVSAVDQSGNESAYASATVDVNLDDPPQPHD